MNLSALVPVVVALLLSSADPVAADATLNATGLRAYAKVKSLHEMRRERIVPQQWDQSCGSAALSTLLTHYLDYPVDETRVIGDMIRHGDPLRVRQRGGFSLLDLKRFAERRGFRSDGYGRLELEELQAFASPAIVPIRTRGYDHFVVFTGVVGDRVMLADPAYGNVSLSLSRFGRVWQNGIALLVAPARPLTKSYAALAPIPRLSDVERILRGLGPVPPQRVGR